MEIGTQIKRYRTAANLSQEELAERIFITRQTLSNWETGKTYPDLNSLLRLSTVFHVSLDELVKGDIPKMKKQINMNDVQEFKRAGNIFSALFFIMVLSAVPLYYFFEYIGIAVWLLISLIALLYSLHVEKLKKQHNIQSYREITAFMEGKRLDELETAVEHGKRPYQKALLVIGSAMLGAAAAAITHLLMK